MTMRSTVPPNFKICSAPSLSRTMTEDPTPKQVTALTERFDSWYRSRNMDALMQGMSDLYERGYRVTPSDRVELDRVMG